MAAPTPRPRPSPPARPRQNALNALAPALPELLGGSADLTGSNLTNTSWTPALRFDADGTPTAATTSTTACASSAWPHIMNGMALHGGFMPYGGTFLMFTDYSRNAMRMAALMKQRVIHVFTHDSIGLGEDGPTHQPVEQTATPAPDPEHGRLASVRHGGNRRGLGRARCRTHDRPERAAAVSRQNLPYAPKRDAGRTSPRAATCWPSRAEVGLKKKAQAVIIATGSEVQLALEAQEAAGRSKASRCAWCRMPITNVFDRQDAGLQGQRAAAKACRASRSKPA